jgi:hypothetical protein
LTTIVLNDGDALGDDGDILGAFDPDGNVRGLGNFVDGVGPSAGLTLHAITVRSDDDGDAISFQYYDASLDEILQSSTTYTFINNDQQGSLLTGGYEINIGASIGGCTDETACNYSPDATTITIKNPFSICATTIICSGIWRIITGCFICTTSN